MNNPRIIPRRTLLGGVLAAGAAASLPGFAADQAVEPARPREFARTIKLGLIGCGSRGLQA